MRICDICRNNEATYEGYGFIDENGKCKELELCYSCHEKLRIKEQHYAYLAYKETVEEITGETPKKKSWLSIFKEK